MNHRTFTSNVTMSWQSIGYNLSNSLRTEVFVLTNSPAYV